TGGSLTSGSALSSASSAALSWAFFFFAAASAPAGKATATTRSAIASLLLVILILVGPVLTFEGPVFLVVAHQAFQLQRREQVGGEAALAQVRDLDLQLLLLADDGV